MKTPQQPRSGAQARAGGSSPLAVASDTPHAPLPRPWTPVRILVNWLALIVFGVAIVAIIVGGVL